MYLAISIVIGTLNKSKGQTFSEVGINMQQPHFSHGQAVCCYVQELKDLLISKKSLVDEHALLM